jgi:aspartokinase
MSEDKEKQSIDEEDLKKVINPNSAIINIQAQMATAFATEDYSIDWLPAGVENRTFSVTLESQDKEKAFKELQEKIQENINSWNVIKDLAQEELIDQPEILAYKPVELPPSTATSHSKQKKK